MMALWWRAAPYLGLCALALVLWGQRTTIAAQKIAVDQAHEAIAIQRASLQSLDRLLTEQRVDLARLASLQDDFRHALESRRLTLETLKRAHPQVRQWADTVLPDPVIRLRERPALTGADAYAEHLRTRRPLPPVSGPPDQQ